VEEGEEMEDTGGQEDLVEALILGRLLIGMQMEQKAAPPILILEDEVDRQE
jgi:hypothetical protein